jgi:lysyl-tRNA synthetase class 1
MFLDEHGEKISKSKGNGLSLDQWLTYGPPESLGYFAYREPKRAKQLHIGVIPRAIDDYWKSVADYPAQELPQKFGNPVHHIHNGDVPAEPLPISFSLLLNLVGVIGNADRDVVRDYLQAYRPGTQHPALDALIDHALAYHRDYVAPTLSRRAPTADEAIALRDLDMRLAGIDNVQDLAAAAQNEVYEVGKTHYGQERLRDWFRALYETLLGSEQGPRMGSFIALYGLANSRRLIAEALAKSA